MRQPEFIFGAKAQKAQVIKQYKKMLSEFERVQHYRNFLHSAVDNPAVFSKLMESTSELKALLATINEETEHITDDGTFDKIFKIGKIYDDVVGNYIKTTFGIKNVGLGNMYEVYSPLNNGQFDNMMSVRDRLVKDGLSIDEANRLAEEFILRTYEDSQGPFRFYQLIESHLEESQKAISAFHSSKSLREVNFYTPTLQEFKFLLENRVKKAGHLRSYLMTGGDLNEYNKLANTVFKNKLTEEPVRITNNSLAQFSTRSF